MNICRWTAPYLLRKAGHGKVVDYLKETEANQWKSQDEIKSIQWIKLKRLLKHCFEHVPYYQNRFSEINLIPEDIQSFEDYSKIPLITKPIIQEQTDGLLARSFKKEELTFNATSGSTGEPLVICIDQNRGYHSWAYNLRHNRWAGYDWGSKVAKIWSYNQVDISKKDLLTPLRNINKYLAGNERFIELNPGKCAEEDMLDYLEKFKVFKPQILLGYTNTLYSLALLAENNTLNIPPIKGIITGAEMLTPKIRKTLENVFQGRVFNRYGSREFDIMASECNYGSLHCNDDNLLFELIETPGEIAPQVVITDLNNFAMPFLRYDIKDYAKWNNEKM